jgi:hypothetical protein
MCTHKLQRGFATDHSNCGGPHEGFGAGRQGRGRGRTLARNLTWECTNKGAAKNRDDDQAADQEQPQDNSKWEGKSDKDNFGEQRNNKSGLDVAETSQGNKAFMRMIIKLLLSIIRIGLLARFVAFSIMRLKTVEGCTMKSVD